MYVAGAAGSVLYRQVSCIQVVLCRESPLYNLVSLHIVTPAVRVLRMLVCVLVAGRLNLQRPGVQQGSVCGEAAEGATGGSQEG